MNSATAEPLRVAELIRVMERSAFRFRRSTDEAVKAEAYVEWEEALRELAKLQAKQSAAGEPDGLKRSLR